MSGPLRYSPPFFGSSELGTIKVAHDGTTVLNNATKLNFASPIEVSVLGATATITVETFMADITANRPSAASAPGLLFFDLTLKYWSYSNGSIWTSLLLDLTNGITGILAIVNGGTGASTASSARTNLGLGSAATHAATDFDAAGDAAAAQAAAQAFATAADATVLSTAETYADAKVIDSIADSDSTHAPSRNAVFDALALKVAGPSSAVADDFAMYDGTTGKLIKDNGTSLDTDGTMAANSDSNIATQKATRTYTDTQVATKASKAFAIAMAAAL
jgi:hypothetical protein